jgi:hypothetical protein
VISASAFSMSRGSHSGSVTRRALSAAICRSSPSSWAIGPTASRCGMPSALTSDWVITAVGNERSSVLGSIR